MSITFRGCHVVMPKLGSFVVRDLGHMLESNSVHIRTVGTFQGIMCASRTCLTIDCPAGRVEIVTFTIKCEVLNVKTEVKSLLTRHLTILDHRDSKNERDSTGHVYSTWRPSSCRLTHNAKQYSLTITRINRILRHCLEKKRSELLCPMSTNR